MYYRNCSNGQRTNYRQINPCCQTVTTTSCTNCGLTVTLTSDVEVACLCSQVTCTVTVSNDSDVLVRNAILTLPLDGAFALLRNTVVVNGQSVAVENLDQVPLGDLEAGSTATVTYTVVVMENKRYVYSRAIITTCVCCCLERKVINVASNLHLIQVCPCCACGQSND